MCPPVSAETESAEDGHSLMAPSDELTRVVRWIFRRRGVHDSHVDDEAQDTILKLLDVPCPVGGQPLTKVYECEQACSYCRGKALLYRVVSCDAIDRIRRYSRDCEVQFPEDTPDIAARDDDDRLFELRDHLDYPKYARTLRAAIAERLTDDERQAVLMGFGFMAFGKKKTTREIAKQLNVSVGKAWYLTHRAITKLRIAFGEQD